MKSSIDCRWLNAIAGLWLALQWISAGLAEQPELKGLKNVGNHLHLADRILPSAKLVSVQADQWGFQFQGKDEPRQFKLDAITRWGNWRGIIGKQAIWLSDGSWLVGEIQLDTKDQLRLQSSWLELDSIPTKAIRAILVSPVASFADWLSLQQSLLSYSGESDSVWLRDRKQLVGVIQADSLTSRSSNIEISVSDQPVKVPLDQVSVIAFSPKLHTTINFDPPVQIGLLDGTLLNGRSVKSTNHRVEVICQSGIKIRSLDLVDDFLNSITYLSCPNQDNVQRLDLVKPASYKHISDSSLEFSLGVNKDLYGQPLITAWRQDFGMVFHGLAMHSTSQVAFRWDGSSARLLAEARLAVNSPDNADAVCKVLLARDGQLAPASEFTLNKQVDSQSNNLVDVDISKSQLVVLLVEKGRQSQYGDHVLWLDPRIVKQ